MLSNLTCALSGITFEDSIKDSCYDNFVTFAEKCLWDSLLIESAWCVESQFFKEALCQIWLLKNLWNIQCD